MRETVYYLNEAEAKAHGKVEAVVTVYRVHRLEAKSENPAITDVEAKATEERIWDDQDIRELAEDETVEEEKVYYKVVIP